MATKPATRRLVRDLNAKHGAGTWRTRVLHDERQIERKVDGEWQFWGWDDRLNVDTLRQDYLDGPSVWHATEFLDETGH